MLDRRFVAFLLGLFVMSGCSLFDSAELVDSPDSGLSGDVGESSSDADHADANLSDATGPTDATDPSDTSQDAATDATAPDDAGEGGCSCLDPTAECIEGSCVLPDLDCSTDPTVCPAHYSCLDGERCSCSDELVCGIECGAHDDCPGEQVCVLGAGVCTFTLACYDDRTCPDGTRCRFPAEDSNPFGRCVKSGDLADEAPCSSDQECESGTCVLGVCASTCRGGFDCSFSEDCVSDPGFRVRICLDNPACNCGSDEFCERDNGVCRSNEICYPDECPPISACSLTKGECESTSLEPCSGYEALVRNSSGQTLCIDPDSSCTSDADCDSDDSCFYAEDDQFIRFGENLGFWSTSVAVCGRVRL